MEAEAGIEARDVQEIAPHPSRGDRRPWIDRTDAKGPNGLLIQSLNCIGAELTEKLKIVTEREQEVDVINVPFQALEPEITMRAINARARRTAQAGIGRAEVEEMGRRVDRIAKGGAGEEGRNRIRKGQGMATWDAERIRDKLDEAHQTEC